MLVNIVHDQKLKQEVNILSKVRFPVFIRERDSRDVDPKVIIAYKLWKKSEQDV